ncbi:SDR family oxidoreductase [Luteolibacter sp. GHJ8]|uniref:SDR family oxidoreductase n=1 Tax=Luteolibacter rhizosphaerae TaxID=2989719 RepID=A0ABT3FZV0_9BACT|nr:SDR family NAD(P)-dependent oxidoreductase [Luteolibacter rhizosphaerae]MCW1912947.1 SDR family oxidoreductase [Luteolibacter rhizosphaerae]
MKFSLDDRVALVTGGGSGIGRAAAEALAEAGAKVVIVGRTPEELDETLAGLGGEERGHISITADVSSELEMGNAFATVANRYARLDIVVANAGINGVWAPLDQLGVSEWDQTLAVNLRGTFLTLKLALPLLRKRGGSVVVVSSINGTRVFSNSGATAYSCSKAAQVAFTKMTALELAKDKIRVNVVCPGAIETNIDDSTERRALEGIHLPVEFPEGDVPLTGGQPGSADQVAQLIGFLACDASSHITGTEIYIEGGQSLLQG